MFRNGFIQALVLGPLIGLGQAFALRAATSRWAWWLAANVTTYLLGALMHQAGDALVSHRDYFPVLAFTVHGAWMLWITAPAVANPIGATGPPSPVCAIGDSAPASWPRRSASWRPGNDRRS